MNINEMLIYADIEHISKIADHYKCQCNRNSKTDTIQAIIYHIFQKDILEESIKQLNVLEYTFEEAYAMIASGQIKDAKTIMLLQYAKINNLV